MRFVKEKTASKRLSRPSRAPFDAVRPYLGSDPASASFGFQNPQPGQVRVLIFLTKSAKRRPQSAIRGETVRFRITKKTPLMQPTSGTVSYKTLQTSAPASTLSLPPTVDPPARCSRGQVQSTSPIHVTNSNLGPTLSIAELIDFAESGAQIRVPRRVPLCRPCVPVTQSSGSPQCGGSAFMCEVPFMSCRIMGSIVNVFGMLWWSTTALSMILRLSGSAEA